MEPSALFKSNNSLFAPRALWSSSASDGAPSPPSYAIPRPRSSPPRLSIDGVLGGFKISGNSAGDAPSSPMKASSRKAFADQQEAQSTVDGIRCGPAPSEMAGENTAPFAHSLIPKTVGTEHVQTMAHLMTPEFRPRDSQTDLAGFDSIKQFSLNGEPNQTFSDPIAASSDLKNHNHAAAAKKKEQKLPRPPNSWILYRSDKIVEMKPQHSGVAQCLLSKEIAVRWRNESQEVKNNYEKKAELIKAEHAIKYPDYKYSPKRRNPNKDGQHKSADPTSPLQKSKRKESAGSKGAPSRSKRKRKPSGPADNAQEEKSKPPLVGEQKPHLIHPDVLEADLYSAYPLLGKLAAAQEIQPQPVLGTVDCRTSVPSFEGPRVDHPPCSAPTYADHFLPSQGYIPVAQPRPEWMDLSRLDPQLQYDNQITSFSGPSPSDWMTTPTTADSSTHILPSSAPSVRCLPANNHQPPSPNPRDFGFFPGSDNLDFIAVDADWLNPNPQNSWDESFLGQPFERSSYSGFGSNHDLNPFPDELPDLNSFNTSTAFLPHYPYLNSQ